MIKITGQAAQIDEALRIAAEEIEYGYQHGGLHEHGIPVPEILRELRAALASPGLGTSMTKEQFDTFEDVMDALYGVNYSKGQNITEEGWERIDRLVDEGYRVIGELRREHFSNSDVTVTGQATTDSPKAE